MVDMPPSHEIVFQPDGKRVSFSKETSVLEAARALGVDINSICGGSGARIILLSREARREALGIRKKTGYVELASSAEYNKEYLDALMFPHKDLGLFPETV